MDSQSIIDRLQAQNRKLKVAGLCVLAALGFAMLKGCGRGGGGELIVKSPVVEAQRFVVRGADGKQRAILGLFEDQRMYLALYDTEGNQRAAMGVEDDGPAVKLYNAEGKMQAVVDLLGERPRMMLFDESGQVRHKAP